MLFRILNIDRSSSPNKFLLGGDSLATSAGGSPFIPFKIRAVNDIPPTGIFKATYDVTSVTAVGNNTEIEVLQPIIVPPNPSLEYQIMALGFYDVNLSDGSFLFESTPLEADVNNSPLTLPGKGVVNYGEMINEDLLRLTENFNNTTEPLNKLTGMFWFNAGIGLMQYWDGTQWVTLPGQTDYETILMTAGQTVITTQVATISRTGNPGAVFIQVFLNGLEQTEGVDYDVTGPLELTWLTPLTLNERVTIYSKTISSAFAPILPPVGSPPTSQFCFLHTQTISSTTWTITHNLGYVPIVTVFIGLAEVIPLNVMVPAGFEGQQVVITFTTPQAGTAKLC